MKGRRVITLILVLLGVLLVLEFVYNREIYAFSEDLKKEFHSMAVILENDYNQRKVKLAKEAKEKQSTTDVQEDEAESTGKQEDEAESTGKQENVSKATDEQENEPKAITNSTESTHTTEEKPTEKIKRLPEPIMSTVEYWKRIYPNMTIGVGLYSLDGNAGFVYNENTQINSACTIKAAYALYVLQECEAREIDIWNTFLTYQEWHSDPDGSGDINLYGRYGDQYSIAELVRLLLQVSDNVAYNILLDEFDEFDFYRYNSTIGGQGGWSKWGKASVEQRKNEWVAIWNYVNSSAWYAQVLREDLTGTQYAYFLQGMQNWHTYMQKSGWTEDTPDYPATCEAAIIDDSYILIVLTEDYNDYEKGHIDVLQSIGGSVESYWDATDGDIF